MISQVLSFIQCLEKTVGSIKISLVVLFTLFSVFGNTSLDIERKHVLKYLHDCEQRSACNQKMELWRVGVADLCSCKLKVCVNPLFSVRVYTERTSFQQ